MSTVDNQTAAADTTTATGAENSSTTANETKMNENTNTNANDTKTAGTAAGEAAKTGLLRTAYAYSKKLLTLAVLGLIVYFFGAAAITNGQAFMANPGVWTAVKSSVFAGVALATLMDLLAPVGAWLKVKVWTPFKGLFAKKVQAAAETTAEAAAASATAAAAEGAAQAA